MAFSFKDSDTSSSLLDTLLTSQLCVSASNAGTIIKATGVQLAGVLDDRHALEATSFAHVIASFHKNEYHHKYSVLCVWRFYMWL
jgi:hypothetical protein